MAYFYLIRHAHADWIPDENRPLSADGMESARQLVPLVSDYPINCIFSSPALRARQTVAPLAAKLGLGIEIIDDLKERLLGTLPAAGFQAAVAQTWHDPSFSHPGGESNAAAQARGTAIIRMLQAKYPEDHIVLGTHGNLLALILQVFDPRIDYAFWCTLTMPDVYLLELTQSSPVIRHLYSAAYFFK